MLETLRKLPESLDAESRFRASLILDISLLSMGITGILAVTDVIANPNAVQLVAGFVVMALCAALVQMCRIGLWRPAAQILLLGLLGGIGWRSAFDGGAGSEVISSAAGVLVLGTILLSRPALVGLVLIEVTMFTVMRLNAETLASWRSFEASAFTDILVHTSQSATVVAVLLLVVGRYRSQREDVEARSEALNRAMAELERTTVSKDHLDNVIGAVRDCIIVTDPRNLIIQCNPATAEQLGRPMAELLGMSIRDVITDEHVIDAPLVNATTTATRSDGRELAVLLSRGRLPSRTNRPAGFVWVLSDMSVQHAAVEAARRAHAQADAANHAKSQFLANMSHELRTPLNAIIGYSELLSEELEETDQSEDLNRIRGAGQHLLGLINGILDLSKVEAGKMELRLEKLELHDLLEQVRGTIRPRMVEAGLAFPVRIDQIPETVRVDGQKLKQILLNLLSNAVKFTPSGSVTLDVQGYPRDGMPWIRFQVTDTGIGMSDEQCERVFEPFAQVHDKAAGEYGGTGLGLSITRAFTLMMGGEIHVDSVQGNGTTFTVDLPIGGMDDLRTPTRQRLRSMPPPRDADEVLILHIDDDPSMLELVTRLLTGPNRRVVGTTEPDQGIAWSRSLDPSLVLLDVQMPLVSGWSVLAQLRELHTKSELKVLMLTAEGEETVAQALGANGLLHKPIDRAALTAVIETTLAL